MQHLKFDLIMDLPLPVGFMFSDIFLAIIFFTARWRTLLGICLHWSGDYEFFHTFLSEKGFFLFHFWKTALVGMAFLTVRSLLSTLWVCQPFFFWPVESANKIMGTCLFVTSQFSFGTSMVPLVWFGFVAVVVVVLMTAAAVVVVVVLLASGFW